MDSAPNTKSSTHTPGPWRVSGNRAIFADEESQPRLVATVVDSGHVNWDANARLIAAAPETTEELEALIEFCEALLDGKAGAVEDIESRLPYAKKALALSRGQS